MSRAVLIISPLDGLMREFYNNIKEAGIECRLENNITVSKQYKRFASRLYIDFQGELDNVDNWFDEGEDAIKYKEVLSELGHETLFVYYVSFGDLYLAKEVLLLIGDSDKLVIDGDSDVVLTGNKFVKRIQDDPDWDWAE